MPCRRHFLATAAAAVVAISATACSSDSDDVPTQPTQPAPTGPATIQITELTTGEGTEAVSGSSVFFHYTLWRYDPAGADSKGEVLDSNAGGNPLSFLVGSNQLISGMTPAIVGMRVGGKRRVILPPNLAYGSSGYGSVRPNEWLVFEIDLRSVA